MMSAARAVTSIPAVPAAHESLGVLNVRTQY